jgi:protein-disulfide isomerase
VRRHMMGLAVGAVVIVGAGAAFLGTVNGKPPEPEVIAPRQAATGQGAAGQGTTPGTAGRIQAAQASDAEGKIPAKEPPPSSSAAVPAVTPASTAAAKAQIAQAQAAPRTTADMLTDRVLGDPNAPVTIYDYSSMTCPHCAAFHTDTLPQLKKDFIDTGKAKLVFRDFPFDAVALRASMLARCSPPERYFGFLDVLFRSQQKWATAQDPLASLAQTGRLAGVSQQDFDACMANEELVNGLVQKRLDAEQKYEVRSTPTFVLVRGDQEEKLVGNQPLEQFAAVIERLAQ